MLSDTFIHEFHDIDDGREKKTSEQVKEFVDQLEPIFIFCIIWSLCCTVNAASRKMYTTILFKTFNLLIIHFIQV